MRATFGVWLALSILLGCGEEAPPRAELVPEPETPSEAPTSERSEVEPEATPRAEPATPPAEEPERAQPPLPTAEPGRAHVFVLGEDDYLEIDVDQLLEAETRSVQRGPENRVSYPQLDLPDARTERLLNERIAALAMAQDGEQSSSSPHDTECEVKLATPSVVSMICSTTIWDERDDHQHVVRGVHFRVDEHGVHDLLLSELFLPGTDLAPIVRRACEQEGEDCDVRYPYALALDESGLHVESYEEVGNFYAYDFVIPYGDVADRILASGPLAQSLDRTDLEVRSIAAETSAAPPAGTTRWAITPMGSFADLAAAWASLPAEQRAVVQRAGSYLVAPDEATARAAATTLGTRPSAVLAPEPRPLVLANTRRELALLRDPMRDAEEVVTLARGTLVTIAEPPSAQGERFLPAVVHAALSGYVDRRQLVAVEGCVPSLDPFLATLPEAARAGARVRTSRNVLAEGSWGRVTYVAEVDGQSHVELRRMEAECAVDRSLVRYSRPGSVVHLDVTRTARRGGESLIVTTTSEPSVSVHTFGNAEPRWTRPLATGERVETSRTEGDAWYPIVIVRPSGELRFAWGPEGLVESAPPSP